MKFFFPLSVKIGKNHVSRQRVQPNIELLNGLPYVHETYIFRSPLSPVVPDDTPGSLDTPIDRNPPRRGINNQQTVNQELWTN